MPVVSDSSSEDDARPVSRGFVVPRGALPSMNTPRDAAPDSSDSDSTPRARRTGLTGSGLSAVTPKPDSGSPSVSAPSPPLPAAPKSPVVAAAKPQQQQPSGGLSGLSVGGGGSGLDGYRDDFDDEIVDEIGSVHDGLSDGSEEQLPVHSLGDLSLSVSRADISAPSGSLSSMPDAAPRAQSAPLSQSQTLSSPPQSPSAPHASSPTGAGSPDEATPEGGAEAVSAPHADGASSPLSASSESELPPSLDEILSRHAAPAGRGRLPSLAPIGRPAARGALAPLGPRADPLAPKPDLLGPKPDLFARRRL
jgi:hypothetical protein